MSCSLKCLHLQNNLKDIMKFFANNVEMEVLDADLMVSLSCLVSLVSTVFKDVQYQIKLKPEAWLTKWVRIAS